MSLQALCSCVILGRGFLLISMSQKRLEEVLMEASAACAAAIMAAERVLAIKDELSSTIQLVRKHAERCDRLMRRIEGKDNG